MNLMPVVVRKDGPTATDTHVDSVLGARVKRKKKRKLSTNGATHAVDNTTAVACSFLPIVKGEAADHPFRGNQWETGQSGGAATATAERSPAQPSTAASSAVPPANIDLAPVKMLFDQQSLGIARGDMPQLKGKPLAGSWADQYLPRDSRGEVDITPMLIKNLQAQGVMIVENSVDAADLKPTQNEFNPDKVAGIAQAMQNGTKLDGDIWTSSDNYVIDGHHRWAATVANEYAEGKPLPIPTLQVALPIAEILPIATKLASTLGIPQQDVTKALAMLWPIFAKGDVPGHTFHGNQYEHITAAEARGNSRPVSSEEFQSLAAEGHARVDALEAQASPPTGLDENFHQLAAKSYAACLQSWGGVTIDAHSGKVLDLDGQKKYALTVKDPGQESVQIPERSDVMHFSGAMQAARQRFDTQLSRPGYSLGIFHDDDKHSIDFDPVLIVDNLHDIETIGAYTHAIGGAYCYADGNGYWPPHVADTETAADKREPAMAKAKMTPAQFFAQSRKEPVWWVPGEDEAKGSAARLADPTVDQPKHTPVTKPVPISLEKARRPLTGRSAFPLVRKGDKEQHDFHGNQWTGGIGGGPKPTLADPVPGVDVKPEDMRPRPIEGVGMTEFPDVFLERMNKKAAELGISVDSVLGNFEKMFALGAEKDGKWYHQLNGDIATLAQKLQARPDAVGAAVSVMASHREWNKNLKDATTLFKIVSENKPFTVTQKQIDEFTKHQMSGRVKHPDWLLNPDGSPIKAGVWYPKTANPYLTVLAIPEARKTMGQTGVEPPGRAVALAQGTMTPEQAVQGVKLRSFYNNMMVPGDDRFATIDTWMYRAGVDPTQTFHTTVNGKLGDYTLAEYEKMYPKLDKNGEQVIDKKTGAPKALKRAPQNLFQASPGAITVDKKKVFPGNVGLYPLFHGAVTRGAKLHGMSPNAYQAIVWYAIKDHWVPADGGRNVDTKDYVDD